MVDIGNALSFSEEEFCNFLHVPAEIILGLQGIIRMHFQI